MLAMTFHVVPVPVLAAPLQPISLLMSLGKKQRMVQVVGPIARMWETQMGSEPTEERALLSPCLESTVFEAVMKIQCTGEMRCLILLLKNKGLEPRSPGARELFLPQDLPL